MNTHTRNLVRASLFALALSGLATPASAIITTFDSSSQAGWVDTQLSESFPTTTQGSLTTTQMNGAAQLGGGDANMMVYSFGDLGIAATDTVNSATLNLFYSSVTTNQTFTVWGLTGTVDNSLTWNNAQATTGFDPSNPGGTIYGSFTGNASAASASATSIDLTAAIQAYIRGDIDGIAIGTTEDGGFVSGPGSRVQIYSSEATNTALRPSLMVDVVPEPSTYALVFGLVALVGVVRRRKNRRSSIPMPA